MSAFASPTTRLRLVGAAACCLGDGRVLALEHKDALLLAYLAVEGPTARARLASMLWPEAEPERARANLRQRLFRLRKTVGFDLLEGVVVARLREDVAVDLDADGAAPGELLPGITPADTGELASWLDATRERRRAARIEALAGLASTEEEAGQLASALASAQQLIDIDPTSEHAHRRVMRLHYLRGDRAAALAAFDRCCDVLQRQLGVAPEPETEALRARIDALAPAGGAGLPQPMPVSVLRPPRLVGRVPELRALQLAWSTVGVATVLGEAGLGKTRLLQALVETTPQAVLTAGRPGDAGVPFTTLARLLRAVLQRADAAATPILLPAARQQIARVLPEWGEGPARDGEAQRFALQRAVRALLASQPGLQGLVIDDLHFADAATLQMLQALIGDGIDPGAGATPLRWVLAYRPAEADSPLRALHQAMLDIGASTRVRLAPLDEAEVAQLVDSLALPGVTGSALAGHLLRRTGGNPLFMLETLKQVWADGSLAALAAGTSVARPQTVQQLIERRLAQLSPAALTLARVAAVAAPDFGIELAEQVLGQPAMQLATAWSELESAQVLRDGGFAHDLVYEVTLDSVPLEIARHTHAAVARWLVAQGGEPARVAGHWIAAGERAAAIAPLREAARRSSARICLAEARALLEQAAQLCAATGSDRQEFAVLFDLHQNYIADDPGAAHEQLVQRLVALASDETERLDAAWAVHNLRRFRQTTSPIAQIEADVARAEQLGNERVLAALATVLVSGYLTLGQPDQAAATLKRHERVYERSVQRTELPDFVGHLAEALGEQDRYHESIPYLRRAAELYRAADEPAEMMVAMCNQTRHLRQQGRVVAAQALFERIDRWHAANAPNPRAWLVSRAAGGEVSRELERYDEALLRLEQPAGEVRQHMGPLYAAFPLAKARLWLALGQLARARQAIDEIGEDLSALPDWLQARCTLAAAQVGASVRSGGDSDRPGDAEWALLERASRLAPRTHRRSAWFECELQRAAWIDPAAGAALAESIANIAEHHGMIGYAQQARLCMAAQRLAGGQVDTALLSARSVLESRWHRFGDESAAEPVFPSGGSAAARDLVVARVLQAAGLGDGRAILAEARERIATVLERHVPAQFRDSFLRRHPVHRELHALAFGTAGLGTD